MKKILVAFDNRHLSAGALTFIARLHELEPVSVTGIFLPEIDYAALWSKTPGALTGPLFVPLAEPAEAAIVHSQILEFEHFCQEQRIRYSVIKDFFDFSLTSFQEETKFADLLIIGSEAFYKDMGTDTVNSYLEDALSHAACPVLLVPEQFVFPQTNILTYDGSEASVYAIKQFSYLFPSLCEHKTLVVYMNEEAEAVMPDEKKLRDLVCRHYAQCAFQTLHLDARKYLATWASEQKAAVLVSGGFGRSALSRLFKQSLVHDAITEHRFPVFIAHR